METEIWKDIDGFKGQYQVSDLGRIKGLPRKVNNYTGFIQLKERYLKGHATTKGYIQVQLASRPRRICRLIHVLVAKAFIPNPNNYPQVNHINGDKADNRVENLEWCTNSMNQIHAYATGLNHVTGRAGRPKRQVWLINVTTGEKLLFESVAEAARFIGGKSHHFANLAKVLSPKYIHHKTTHGYAAEYAI